MALGDRNTSILFMIILYLTNVTSCEFPETFPYPYHKHQTEKQCMKQTFAKSEKKAKTLGREETCHTHLKRKCAILEELSKQMKAMEERLVSLENRVDGLNEDREEAVSKLGKDIKHHKDLTEDHPKKLEQLKNSVDGLESTVSKHSGLMESLNNRVENIDVWKTDIANSELLKIRQDAKDGIHGVEQKVDKLTQDVWNISTNVTSVNIAVSKLTHNVKGVVPRLDDLDTLQKRLLDTGDATRKNVEEAKMIATENARNIQTHSLEMENITKNLTGINNTMSTMYQAMNESAASLMSWRTEMSEKELPMMKQNITDNRNKLEEARHNASANSRLLQGHIMWANDTSVELRKQVNETLEREKELKDEHNSMKVEVDKLNNVSEILSVDIGNLNGNVRSLQHSAEIVQTQVSRNIEKLEAVTQVVGNITTNITAINKTAEHLSSQVNVTKQDVESLASWRKELVRTELPALKQDVEQVQRNTNTNGDVLKGHIVWANWTYEEFQKHRNATDKKVAEFTGKHDTTDRKLDGEELEGAMTKAELSQLKGKSTFHDVSFLLTLLNTIVGGFLIMYMWQGLSTASAAAPAAATTSSKDVQRGVGREVVYRREEVYELSWTEPMEDSLCVVTFHTETELKHADQTRSVFASVQQPCPTIHTRVIRCHSDIKHLPGSRVFLVYVDFNERNVILEDPTKGLGDLRVTTVRSLWGFGADVTVIYCGDRGSMNLGSGLFNSDLGSIHRQRELTQLKKSGRILSICSDFSKDQKEHCRNFINRLLKGKNATSADYDFNNQQ